MSEDDKGTKRFSNQKKKDKDGYETKWGYQMITHPGKICNYCKKRGHILSTCVKKHSIKRTNMVKESTDETEFQDPFKDTFFVEPDSVMLPKVSSEDLEALRKEREKKQAVTEEPRSPYCNGDMQRNPRKVDDDDFSLPSSDSSDESIDDCDTSQNSIQENLSYEMPMVNFVGPIIESRDNVEANLIQSQSTPIKKSEKQQELNDTSVATDMLKKMLNINNTQR